jgi:hypothetical protein
MALLARSMPAWASCNTIPDYYALQLHAASPDAEPGKPGPSDLRFKAALGRVGTLYPVLGETARITVAADGVCVGATGKPKALAVPPLGDLDGLVGLLLFERPDDRAVFVQAYGSAQACAHLDAALKPADEGAPKLQKLGECRRGGLERLPDHGPNALGLAFPGTASSGVLTSARGDAEPMAIPTRVVVAAAPDSDEKAAALIAAADRSCAESCEASSVPTAVCADYFYAYQAGTFSVDKVPCRITSIPAAAKNEFLSLCEDGDGSSGLTPCTPAANPVKLFQDTDVRCIGGVHAWFSWGAIRKKTDGTNAEVDRVLGGASAIGRKQKTENPAVYVPGREFIGSTPAGDASGDLTGGNWRWPQFEVWYPNDGESFGLKGVVDKNDDAIAHIYPRLRTSVVCKGSADEACMAVARQLDGTGVGCACTDRHPASCACEELATKRYFACKGGSHEDMPCTRSAHCPDGTCDRQPICRTPDSVWPGPLAPQPSPPSTVPYPPQGATVCSVDDDCGNAAVNHTMCGYRLFDLSGSVGSDKIIRLPRKCPAGASAKCRGVCEQAAGTAACSNDSGPEKPGPCASGVDCRGYLLNAFGEVQAH